jgi:glycosyltransferase involved in cell wall biosynthesis
MIDIISIICISILIVLAIVSSLTNAFLRRPYPKEKKSSTHEHPKVSIIITCQDNPQALDAHLPLFLTQDYEPGYEVIVVANESDNDTEEVLKRYSANKHLYTTFVPDSSRYMSRNKLAVTLGVKAAKNEWIILTEACCRPNSDEWLNTISDNFTTDKNLVIGYTNYDEDSKPYHRFEHLLTSYYVMRKALCGTAFRTNNYNLAFRKSIFMKGNGYQGNLKYIRGEYDFIVNKYAHKGNAAVEVSPEAWLVEDAPSKKTWHNKHVFYIETRKHLLRNKAFRSVYGLDMTMMYMNYIAIIACGVFSIITGRWIISIAVTLALLITIVLRTIIAKKAIRTFEADVPIWKVIPYEISLIWHNIGYRLRYSRANKYDFISHKI